MSRLRPAGLRAVRRLGPPGARTLRRLAALLRARPIGWLALLLAALLAGPAPTASANGVPVEVFLSYLPDISNWGPRDATARGVVAVADGRTELEVEGLEPQPDGRYWVWLESPEGEVVPIGSFQAEADATSRFLAQGLRLPDATYRLVFVTFEAAGKTGGPPGDRRSIAGRFPNPQAVIPSAQASGTTVGELPQELPQTGAPGGTFRVGLFGLAAALGIALLAAEGLLRLGLPRLGWRPAATRDGGHRTSHKRGGDA